MPRAFVVGNGPSLKAEQLDILHRNECISFGVNRIHLIYDQTTWRPIHWLMMDYSNSLYFREDIHLHAQEDYPCHVRSDILVKYFEWCLRSDLWPIFDNLSVILRDHCEHIDVERYTSDAWHEPYCHMGGSVPVAIQLAVQMGYDPIYTIGMDGNRIGNAENNFIAGYIDVDNVTVPKARVANETAELALDIALRECKTRGFELIDATVGGSAYEVLPEVDFWGLFPSV